MDRFWSTVIHAAVFVLALFQLRHRRRIQRIRPNRPLRPAPPHYHLDGTGKTFPTSIGEVTLRGAITDDFKTAVLVYLPANCRLTQQMSGDFTDLTDGVFRVDTMSGTNDGDDRATAIIVAAYDRKSYDCGAKKYSSALEKLAGVLQYMLSMPANAAQ